MTSYKIVIMTKNSNELSKEELSMLSELNNWGFINLVDDIFQRN